MALNIDYLGYFLDVAKTKSITRAAKLNFISPQGMSRAMNELEKELGCELFVRYSNKLSLSPIGEELTERAKDIIDRYGDLLRYAAEKTREQERGSDSASLLFSCNNIAMLAFLPQQAKDFIFASPNIHFRENSHTQGRQLLKSNAASNAQRTPAIGLVSFFDKDHSADESNINEINEDGYIYRAYLTTLDQAIVCKRSHLAEKALITNKDIASKPIVCTNSHLEAVISNRFGRDAIEVASSDFSLRRRMVESDAAISFLPAIASLTMPEDYGFVFKDMEDPYEVEVGFIGTEEDLASEPFTTILRMLNDFYGPRVDTGKFTLRW